MSTDELIGANLARIRDQRGLSLRKLAELLGEIGRPINADSLNRAEKGRRQISATELVALAIALEVSPLALLLPREPTDPIALAPTVQASWQSAWRWAVGEQPLVRAGEQLSLPDPRVAKFVAENRPFEGRSLVDEVGRWLISRSSNPNPLRWVVDISHDGHGRWQGQVTITAGDDGQH